MRPEPPDVRYARSGEVSIAYATVGEGPVDVVFVRGFAGDLISAWEQPLLRRFIEDVAEFARVTMLDKRGTGLSDRVREVPTLETRMDDLRAVMDDVGAEDAVVWTAQEGARLASLLAATYPERTRGLVLFDPSAKGRRTADYPWALDEAEWRTRLREIREGWGRTEFLDARLAEWAPERCDDPDFRLWFLAHMRRGLSPGSALAFFRMTMESDVTDVLPVVRVPTVVLSSATNRGPARYFAERIPGARLVDLPVRSIYHWVDDESHTIAIRETKRLVEETQSEVVADRILATMLFTDIVGSTSRAAELGDSRWRELVEAHHALVRTELRRFRGEEQDTAGDGFSLRSTVRLARFAVRLQLSKQFASSASTCGPACTPASARSSTRRSEGSRSTSPLASQLKPRPGRYSSRTRSRTSSRGPESSSTIGAPRS
jgi:pimeloyl-ACP methyl ester carboxylesterase